MKMLLLEDTRADARMLVDAFQERDGNIKVDVVETVDDAIAYIDQAAAGRRTDIPALAVLDIRVPGGSGIDVLNHLRGQAALRTMPVIMLTSSDADADIQAAKEGGATTYYVKPMDLEGFDVLAAEIRAFWLERRVGPTD